MARSISNPKIDSRTSRLKLEAGRKYWSAIAPEVSVGYRRPKAGSGVWICRVKVGDKEPQTTIGSADDYADADGHNTLTFHQALDKCREVAAKARQPAHMVNADMTVGEIVSAYMEGYNARGGKSPDQARSIVQKYIMAPLGKDKAISTVLVGDLTPAVIKNWHSHIATTPPTGRGGQALTGWEPTQENLRKRQSTANRVRTLLVAALNWGFEHGHIANDIAWKKTKPFKDADQPIVQFIGPSDCVKLLNACDDDFRLLVRAALLTGARYGELCSLKVGAVHLDKRFIQIVESKSGKSRTITLNPEGLKFFELVIQNKGYDEPVFTRNDGKVWGKSHQDRRFATALEKAGLSPDFSFHDLRHSYASMLIQAGVAIEVIADLLGHADTRITLRHYAHLVDSVRQDAVAKLPSFGAEPETNVVKLTRKAG